MLCRGLWHREIGCNINACTVSWPKTSSPYLKHLLTLFSSWRRDIHLVHGDIDASPDVESVAGTVVKFCETYSSSNLLALADEDGIIYLFNTLLTGPESLVSKWSVHKNAIFDLEWLPFVPRIVTASGHQIACLIDVNTKQTIDTFKGHVSSLKTIASRKADPYVFATGGRDGCICIWDQRVSRRGNTVPTSNELKNAHASGSRLTRKSTSPSITGLCFQDEMTLVSCASNDSVVKVWDLRRSYKTHKSDPVAKYSFSYHGKSLKQVGYSGLVMDHSRSFIYANCIDDCVYQFSGLGYQDEAVACYRGHRNKTFFVKSAVSPDDEYLLTGSSDSSARIYRVKGHRSGADSKKTSPVSYQLQGHREEVTSVAWSRFDPGKIATISDDDTLRVWRLGENFADDAVEGSCSEISTEEEGAGMTRIRSKSSAIGGGSSRDNTERARGGASSAKSIKEDTDNVLPWPILNGIDIQPRLCSPKKLLISPRKSAGSAVRGNHAPATGPSSLGVSCPLGQTKRKLMDSDFPRSPSKRLRERAMGSRVITSPTSTNQLTLSPIRINNSSKPIINVTPTTVTSPSITACWSNFSSPTANLPNSVLDPQTPRRFIDKENSSCSRRKPAAPNDWLSQLSKEKQLKLSSPSSPSSDGTPSRSGQHKTRRSSASKTPSGNKKVAQTLMMYFSPTSEKPPTPTTSRSDIN